MGLGARTPFGIGPVALLDGLCRAQSAFRRYAPFERAGLKFPIAAAVPEAVTNEGVRAWPDRAARLLEGAVRDAIADATGLQNLEGFAGVSPRRIALVTGTSSSGIGPFCSTLAGVARNEPCDTLYGSATSMVADALGVAGPVITICSVCASGALAIAEAAQLVEEGTVDVAIAAGFDPLEPFVGAGFDSLNALAEVPRPFRAERRGLALGEGSAAVVLASSNRWKRPTRGVVAGWGGSADAHHLTAPEPQGRGVALAIERALTCAGIGRDAIGVINAHGTGTLFNDAMESNALARVFGERAGGRPVYTVKGTIGHTLGAAGAIEAVVSFAAMAANVVPPTVTSGPLDPRCDLDVVTESPRVSDARWTLSLSSAFGGANCALVLGSADVES